MKHLFVPYEIALQLKEKGFDAPCFAIYRDRMDDFGVTLVSNGISIYGSQSTTLYHNSNNEMICLAPLYQQVISWLFKKLEIQYPYLEIKYFSDNSGCWYQSLDEDYDEFVCDFNNFNEAIEEALKLI